MYLGEFQEYIKSLPKKTVFDYSISDPMSFRGYYDEVAFEIEEGSMTREECLKKIKKALTDTFTGYKGGEYTYNEYTPIHFCNYGHIYDGEYTGGWIAKIENKSDVYKSQEERLVKLAFVGSKK